MFKARKALRRLKGIVRCRNVMKEISIENQPSVALNHIHFWTKIQSEIKARRMYMVTQGRIQQKKLENKLKLEAKLHDLEVTNSFIIFSRLPISHHKTKYIQVWA